MKTVTLKFVVPDSEEDDIQNEISHALEYTGLSDFYLYGWYIDDSTDDEKGTFNSDNCDGELEEEE